MPIFTLSKEFEHGGKKYPAGLVEASDAAYMAAREAGAIAPAEGEQEAQEAPEPQQGKPVRRRETADSEAETRAGTATPDAPSVPRRERAKNGGEA